MRILVGFCFVCLLTIEVLAQSTATISGKISVNQPPLKVTVILKKSGHLFRRTISNANGSYKFEKIPDGIYQISVMSDGLDSLPGGEGREVSIADGRSISLDFTLDVIKSTAQPSPPIRETVTVSAGERQTIDQVSKTVDVISAQELRDRADFSLVESLRTIPGFRVQQLGGFGRTASIKTRGLRNQDTALLIDGIRFRDASAITGDASPFLSDLTLTSVSQLEVLRGSGSSLYGTNAIGGVVDFQTPTARSGTHGQIGGAVGGLGLGRFRGNISHGLSSGKFGIGAGLSRTAYTKGIDGQDNASNTNFQTRIDANPFSKTSISGRIYFSDAKVRLNSGPDTLGTLPATNATIIDARSNVNFIADANDPDSTQKSRFFNGQIVVNQVVNSKLFVAGYYQGSTTKRTNDDGPLGVGFQSASTSVFDGRIDTANAHFTWIPVVENTLTAGYEFERETFANDGRTPSGTDNFFTRAGQRSNTLYAQDLLSLLDGSLQLAGGLRVQAFGIRSPEFSRNNAPYDNLTLTNPPTAYTFDGSASYFVKKTGTKLRGHVGNGYRVPSLFERFGTFFNTFAFPNPRFEALGDPFLKPEKTVAFDAGVEQSVAANRLRLTATYFYTRLSDIIGFGNSVPSIGSTGRPFGGYENQKGGIARGGEFSAKIKATSSTDIFTSYTFTNSDQRTPQVTGNRNISTLGIPLHQFTLVATQRFKRLWVNFDFVGTSSYLAPIFSNSTFSTYIYRFNGNRKGDLTGGYTFGFKQDKATLRMYGTIENVFNYEYFENGFRTSGATGRVGLTFGF